MKIKKTIIFFNISLAFLPILDVYDSIIGGLSIGQMLLLFSSLIVIFDNYKKFKIENTCFAIVLYIIIRFIFLVFDEYIDWQVATHSLISELLFFFFLIVACNFFNLNVFQKVYIDLSCVVSVLALIQFVLYSVFNRIVILIIPGLPLSAGVTRGHLLGVFSRIEACFTEPAHLVQFLSVALILLLSKTNKKKLDYIKIALFAFVCMLTYSGNAILVLSLLIAVFCCFAYRKKKNRLKIICSLVVLFLAITTLYFQNEMFRTLVGRIDEIIGKSPTSISGYVRVLRGYELFFQFPFIYQLFGSGYGNILNFCEFYHLSGRVYVSPSNPLYSYLNGVQYYLLGGGYIGFLIFVYLIFHGRGKSSLHTYAVTLYVGLSFIAATQASCIGLILLVIILNSKVYRKRQVNFSLVLSGKEKKCTM